MRYSVLEDNQKKYETCESLRNEVISFHVTLGKSTMYKQKLYLILSSQIVSHNKNGLGYKPNRLFSNI